MNFAFRDMATSIAFNQLETSRCSLVDLGSTFEFFSTEATKFIGEAITIRKQVGDNGKKIFPKFLKDILRNQPQAMRLLELIVVNDFLVLDEAVLDRHARFPLGRSADAEERLFRIVDSPWILTCRIPESVRKEAASEINRNRGFLRKLGARSHCREPFHSGDKIAHDNLFEKSDYIRYCYADSSETAERAFFYLTVAGSAGVPLSVGPEKQRQIEMFSKVTHKAIHEHLTQIALKGSDKKEIESYSESVSTPMPPIQEMIIHFAYENGISPLDSCLEIRNSKYALAYRKLVHNLFSKLKGNLGDRNEAKSELVKIHEQIKEWQKFPGMGRRYTRCELDLGKIPKIGWLAEFTGKFRRLSIPDVILTQPPAIVFMSRWFTQTGKK